MIILSNCLTETADEGCLKLASSLIKRIKRKQQDSTLITYDRESAISDIHLNINKFMVSRELFSIIRKKKEAVLYVPFSARQNFSAMRIFILSLVAKKGLYAVTTLNRPYNILGRILLKLSRAKLIAFSEEARKAHADIVGDSRVIYLKTGVDTSKFVPVSKEKSKEIKEKYGFEPDRPIVLHVGHMKYGRNVSELAKIDQKYQVLLVTSTATQNEQDYVLREELSKCSNIRIIDTFIPEIQEIYQLSDVYFFPVKEVANCIDVPLSCMEAAACNLPVVTTDYAEMKEFVGADSFYFIDNFEAANLNNIVAEALNRESDSRRSVLSYDWDNAVEYLINTVI